MVRGKKSNKKVAEAQLEDATEEYGYSGQKTIQAYKDEGLDFEKIDYWPEGLKQCLKFISEVDVSKRHLIDHGVDHEPRELQTMGRVRVMQVDPKTKKRTYRDFLIYTENWYGVNWLGELIAPVTSNIMGLHEEPLLRPRFDDSHRKILNYEMSGKRLVHETPFTKKAVDEIIEKYGMGDQKDFIKYYFFQGGGETYTHSMRTTGYTYKQFTESSFEEMYQLAVRPGGPRGITNKNQEASKLGSGVA